MNKTKRREYQKRYYRAHLSVQLLRQRWRNIKLRCYYPRNYGYKYYGARGITLCDEWKNDFENFKSWALQNGYDLKLHLHRIDGNGNYTPENCQFITAEEHAKLPNRGSRLLSFQGKTQSLARWAREIRISRQALEQRLKRFRTTGEALTASLGAGKTGRKKGSYRVSISSSIYRDRGKKVLSKSHC